ncbi:hypothetical protein PsorP6_007582 [Peronosclerospora sorghi]|uniref:Uncharacterized protein n=1 Tax=Peronosclerospora sorghi TaxID=230839 RepID=A0ACC0W7Z0_9STRA|nr:hypothetical protein PsorP6_007582 [Peronosclerospora sorghi]
MMNQPADQRPDWFANQGRCGKIQKVVIYGNILAAGKVLDALVNARDFVTVTANQKYLKIQIKDTRNWTDFFLVPKKGLSILKPLDAAIIYYQSDSVSLWEVYLTFAKTPPEGINNIPSINRQEREYLLMLNHSRFDLMYRKAHGISYVLDPRFLGYGCDIRG